MSFVLEISEISGIAQNVSMLITVVMRIVAVVGGEKRKGENECGWNPEPSVVQILFTKHKDIGASSGDSHGKCLFRLPPHPPTPRFLCSGAPFVIDHKKVPFDFPLLVRQLQVVHSTEIKSVSHETFFFHFPLPPFAQLIRTLKPTNNFPSREMKSRLQQEENRRHHKKAPVWFQIPRSAIKRCDVFLF